MRALCYHPNEKRSRDIESSPVRPAQYSESNVRRADLKLVFINTEANRYLPFGRVFSGSNGLAPFNQLGQ